MRVIVGRLKELRSSLGTEGNAFSCVKALKGLMTKFYVKEVVKICIVPFITVTLRFNPTGPGFIEDEACITN